MAAASSSSSSTSSPQYRSRFGDTTWTKVFVGGLAWETPTEELRRYFEQFGDILEAVVITDKATGRSKGYGFVTFRDAEAARRSVADPNPVIDGRRANCNIASLGRPRTSPRQARSQEGSTQQGPPQGVGPTYSRVPAQVPHPMIYPTPFGYVAYPSDYGYHQQGPTAMYNPQMAASYYYQQMYGPTSPSNFSPTGTYHYSPHQLGYPMQGPAPPRASFPSLLPGQQQQQQQGRPFMGASPFMGLGQNPSSHMETVFHLQPPPHARQQQQPLHSSSIGPQQAPQQAASSGGANSTDEHSQDA